MPSASPLLALSARPRGRQGRRRAGGRARSPMPEPVSDACSLPPPTFFELGDVTNATCASFLTALAPANASPGHWANLLRHTSLRAGRQPSTYVQLSPRLGAPPLSSNGHVRLGLPAHSRVAVRAEGAARGEARVDLARNLPQCRCPKLTHQ